MLCLVFIPSRDKKSARKKVILKYVYALADKKPQNKSIGQPLGLPLIFHVHDGSINHMRYPKAQGPEQESIPYEEGR